MNNKQLTAEDYGLLAMVLVIAGAVVIGLLVALL